MNKLHQTSLEVLLSDEVIPDEKVKELVTRDFIIWRFSNIPISKFLETVPSEHHPVVGAPEDYGKKLVDILAAECPKIVAILIRSKAEKFLAGLLDAGTTDLNLPMSRNMLVDDCGMPPFKADVFVERQKGFVFRALGKGEHVNFGAGDTPPYLMIKTLGAGSDSIVSSARSLVCAGELVAIKRSKLYKPGPVDQKIDPEFFREIDLMRRLEHPHLVQCLATYSHKNELFTVMYPLGETNLKPPMKNPTNWFSGDRKDRKTEIILNWMNVSASAIKWLHRMRIVHQDIKPENFILRGEETFLADWGKAREFDSAISAMPVPRSFGTPEYSAPESREKGSVTGRALDIFPLGCIYLEFLNTLVGRSYRPFRAQRKVRDPILAKPGETHTFRGHTRACIRYFDDLKTKDDTPQYALDILELAEEMVDTLPDGRPSADVVSKTLKDIVRRSFHGNMHCGSPEAGEGKDDSDSDDDDDI